jgi:hypothetical protein
MKTEESKLEGQQKQLDIPVVMPRISHFIDENGKKYRLNVTTLQYLISIRSDGTLKFTIVKKSTLDCIDVSPVYAV